MTLEWNEDKAVPLGDEGNYYIEMNDSGATYKYIDLEWENDYGAGKIEFIPEPTPSVSSTGSPLFPSEYYDSCKECKGKITPGDMIGYAAGHAGPLCSYDHGRLDDFVPYGNY